MYAADVIDFYVTKDFFRGLRQDKTAHSRITRKAVGASSIKRTGSVQVYDHSRQRLHYIRMSTPETTRPSAGEVMKGRSGST